MPMPTPIKVYATKSAKEAISRIGRMNGLSLSRFSYIAIIKSTINELNMLQHDGDVLHFLDILEAELKRIQPELADKDV